MNIYTIGFTKKSAEQFFELLKMHGVKKVIDIRLNNKSQLAGFTKFPDIKYFLKISGIDYIYLPDFAPARELLDDYKKKKIKWEEYEEQYYELLKKRNVFDKIKELDLNNACLLCSEEKPDRCHRRLLAEFIQEFFLDTKIIHIE